MLGSAALPSCGGTCPPRNSCGQAITWLYVLARYSSSPVPVPGQTRPSGFCYSENDMASQTKLLLCGLRALLLALALRFGGAVIHARQAPAAPPPSDSKAGLDADCLAASREALTRIPP